jgi:hypothetical protein
MQGIAWQQRLQPLPLLIGQIMTSHPILNHDRHQNASEPNRLRDTP